jgi:prephenate dehydrogenase
MSAMLGQVTVVGLGLLGGSVASAARTRGLARRVVGVSRGRETAAAAEAAGVVDEAGVNLAAAARDTDLLVLATPVWAMADLLRRAAPALREGALVTDVGSVKAPLAETLPGLLPPGVHYVGAHPMAGSHASGLAHARADLLEGAVCVVAPPAGVPEAAVAAVERFWKALGTRVCRREPARHDAEVGWVSHLPHAVAYAFSAALAQAPLEAAALRGPGFRDFTRIAGSEPELWADILVQNRKALSGPLAEVGRRLDALARRIEAGDAEGLERLLAEARDALARLADDARSGGANPEIQAARKAASKE